MKNILNKYVALFAIGLLFASCGDQELVTYNEGGVQTIADPFLQINTPVVSFQAGTPDYELDFNVINGERTLTKVNVYSIFTDASSGMKSDQTLLKSYDIAPGAKFEVSDLLTYDVLKNGVTVNGNALPSDQNDLAIGSGWVLSFEGETAQGPLDLLGKVNVAVLSKFAGLYTVIESDYYRINTQSVPTNDWVGQTRFIGSVDETTFSYNDFWGPFGWSGSSFNFTINPTDNTIIVPIVTESGLFSGNRAVGCHDEPEIFVDLPCGGSNILEEDAGGKHRITMTYGYFTDGSGSRQFYEVLEKI